MIKYAQKYLKLGWDLVAVNALGEATLDLDFQQPEEIWSPQLTSLGIGGTHINLGVRTGSPSRLLVLEVHRAESLAPFNQRGEWGSGCVAEVGNHREQHYFVVPRGWQPPPSFFLESFQIMVFGEEGMVLAPPSLEPQAQMALRWLRPPWESPPTRPSTALCKFLKESSPALPGVSLPPLPQVPTWSEVYPLITPYPSILQALLAPAATPEDYYQHLVAAAREVGLQDPQVLLGILWHAPRAEGTHPSQRWEYFQRLVRRGVRAQDDPSPGQAWEATRPGPHPELPPPAEDSGGEELMPRDFSGHSAMPASGVARPPLRRPAAAPKTNHRRPRPGDEGEEGFFDSWSDLFRLSQHNLVVDRQRYEAMIYELGKWGAWQEIVKRMHRENRGLQEKIENQWNRELEFLRQLSLKTEKKGGRRW